MKVLAESGLGARYKGWWLLRRLGVEVGDGVALALCFSIVLGYGIERIYCAWMEVRNGRKERGGGRRGGDRWEGGRNCCHTWDLALKAEGVHQKSVQWAIHAQGASGVQKHRTYVPPRSRTLDVLWPSWYG